MSAHAYRMFCRAWALALVLTAHICAASAEGLHFVRFSADFSYARDMGGAAIDRVTLSYAAAQQLVSVGQAEALRSSNGLAPALGIGYRYQQGHLLLDVGLGVSYRHRWNRPADLADIRAAGVDQQGYSYTGHHTWRARRQTMQHIGAQLPLMVGGQWDRAYFLVGAKLNVDAWGKRREDGLYTQEGEYDRYLDYFRDMPENGFVTDQPYAYGPNEQSIGWDVRACAEVGLQLNQPAKKTSPLYYASLFAEYGAVSAKGTYNPLVVGVRLTVLLPIPTPEPCRCLTGLEEYE